METIPTPTETELNIKLWRIHNLLEQSGLDALLLRQTSNFAWATCGASSYINRADLFSNSSLLIAPTSRHLLTDNISRESQPAGWTRIESGGWFIGSRLGIEKR